MRLARKLGWRTVYHVAWTSPFNGGYTLGDGTYIVKPWLSTENFGSLRQSIANDAKTTKDKITINSVTRL